MSFVHSVVELVVRLFVFLAAIGLSVKRRVACDYEICIDLMLDEFP